MRDYSGTLYGGCEFDMRDYSGMLYGGCEFDMPDYSGMLYGGCEFDMPDHLSCGGDSVNIYNMKENKSKEDKIMMALAEDKIRQCSEQYMITHTSFLDLHQRSVISAGILAAGGFKSKLDGGGLVPGGGMPAADGSGLLPDSGKSAADDSSQTPGSGTAAFGSVFTTAGGVRCLFYGGYADAERTVMVCLPDYAEPADLGNEKLLTVLRVRPGRSDRMPGHRDYLGSLLGLGIKREMTGDILVGGQGADIIVMQEIAGFLKSSYNMAGRVPLTVQEADISEIKIPAAAEKLVKDTVSSLRLDNVLAAGFGLSRSRAEEAVTRGLVFLNDSEESKPSRQIEAGDKIVLRGSGKITVVKTGGRSRKDRVYVTLKKYV